MPFLKRENIDPAVRAPHEKAYKAQLKKALINPALSPAEREDIKVQLESVGKPKVYRKDSPPKPGALALE